LCPPAEKGIALQNSSEAKCDDMGLPDLNLKDIGLPFLAFGTSKKVKVGNCKRQGI